MLKENGSITSGSNSEPGAKSSYCVRLLEKP